MHTPRTDLPDEWIPPVATIRGRGAAENPANRFEHLAYLPERGAETFDEDAPALPPTVYLRDSARTALTKNDSPDIDFDTSLNPYRGCEHGCAYCYARPTHEYLGFSAGLDFETKIVVKQNAAALLRKELSRSSWVPQPIGMSGVTDP